MRGPFALAFAAVVVSCSSPNEPCVPGASAACAGNDGCTGAQVCKQDGSGFDACVCSGASSSSSSAGSGSTGGAGGAGPSASGSSGGPGGASGSAGGAGGATSTGVGGNAGAGAWGPSELPGLALWLETDVGVVEDPQNPGNALKWQDQSGHGLLATAINLQTGWGFAIDPVALNGHNALRCPGNGTSFQLPDDEALHFGSGDFTLAAVVALASYEAGATFYWVKDAQQGGRYGLEENFPGSLLFNAGGGVVEVPDSPAFHVAVMRRSQSVEMWVDGAYASGPVTPTDIDNPGAPLYICEAGGSTSNTIEIAEIFAVKGAVSDASITQINAYLRDKYGL